MGSRELTRNFRKNLTQAEKILWDLIRSRKLNGIKFLRQHPIYFKINRIRRFFVADFYCAEARLIIEIDGKIHEKQKEYDEYRTYLLNNLGYKVIRFQNEEVIDKTSNVLKKLITSIKDGESIPPL